MLKTKNLLLSTFLKKFSTYILTTKYTYLLYLSKLYTYLHYYYYRYNNKNNSVNT